MHYARTTFSKGSYLDTIQPIHDMPGNKKPEIGQRIKLSEGDIDQTNLLYSCPSKFTKLTQYSQFNFPLFLACGRTFQSTAGTFFPPVINENSHDDYLSCEWRIQATHGERIILNVTQMDIAKSPDCLTDYIEIRDGYWHNSPLLGLFCGTGQYVNIVSTGSRMLVTFIAKNPKGHKGFVANYDGKRFKIFMYV